MNDDRFYHNIVIKDWIVSDPFSRPTEKLEWYRGHGSKTDHVLHTKCLYTTYLLYCLTYYLLTDLLIYYPYFHDGLQNFQHHTWYQNIRQTPYLYFSLSSVSCFFSLSSKYFQNIIDHPSDLPLSDRQVSE